MQNGNFIVKYNKIISNGSTVISGEILDKETKSPLPGIVITEKGTVNSTSSDIDGKFSLKINAYSAILTISSAGYFTEELNLAEVKEVDDEDNDEVEKNSLTSLSGLFLANLGGESTIQPNIMLSQSWILGRHGVELRIMGLQNNKDTAQLTNGLNLIKPEISKINFRITGDFIPFKKIDKLNANAEINLFRQQLNYWDVNQNAMSNDITSMLLKLTLGYQPADGLHFFTSGVYYKVFEGIQYYENRFGSDAITNFWNFEVSGKFIFKTGAFKGSFIQAAYNINSNNYRTLINTKDSGVFLIRIGFNKELLR